MIDESKLMKEPKINTHTPDPVWDYYTLWHELIHIKAKIDQALNVMKNFEEATSNSDEQIKEILEPVSDSLIAVIDGQLSELIGSDDNEEE